MILNQHELKVAQSVLAQIEPSGYGCMPPDINSIQNIINSTLYFATQNWDPSIKALVSSDKIYYYVVDNITKTMFNGKNRI